MVQREWVEKEFYKVLGVSSDASESEIRRVAKKLLAENHPDRNPGDAAAAVRIRDLSAVGAAATTWRPKRSCRSWRPPRASRCRCG